jgi:hypothetical protein
MSVLILRWFGWETMVFVDHPQQADFLREIFQAIHWCCLFYLLFPPVGGVPSRGRDCMWWSTGALRGVRWTRWFRSRRQHSIEGIYWYR